ncbi:type II secretion system F family protein [Mycobacterium sp. ML4]
MTGVQLCALLLASALAVAPASSRARLAPAVTAGRRNPPVARVGGWLCGCALAVVAFVLPLSTVLAGALAGAVAGVRYRRRRTRRRAAHEGRALQAGLDVLVGELRVGAHPVQAFDVAADETDGAVSAAMRAVAARARLGADVAAGLRAAAGASALPQHWERLAACWQLATEHGLGIATLMRAAQRDIAERQRFSATVASGLAGARATAAILAGLPLLGLLLGQLMGARPLRYLFSGHAGGWFLMVGIGLTCLGLWWSDRITDRVVAA